MTSGPIHSFPPVIDDNARTLILGSMPGRASLDAAQYYANPRNGFWRIISAATNSQGDMDYRQRLDILKENRIALWDVLASCERKGSLDASIENSSIVPNDFSNLFRQYIGIDRIFFNGGFAESAYKKYVLPTLNQVQRDMPAQRLPSTSPAHAGLTFVEKLSAWRVISESTR